MNKPTNPKRPIARITQAEVLALLAAVYTQIEAIKTNRLTEETSVELATLRSSERKLIRLKNKMEMMVTENE